ncbi:hypothetical protein [Citricoccus sp. I39-566]|uniref:hypothetical protein n=1 Tax=Citricoccus sp. I39-566 TaxID=3073268 RepID=UPI00286C43BD|nr:hypothetical protein [Citricoccus sp. I39-566]WMY80069.1 hypothetical protein RE421_16465 [Citricoccus sp. I39-566]
MTRHAIYDSMQEVCADILTRSCPFCGQQGWITVPQVGADALMDGRSVHEALSEVDHRLREQIISGIHPRCYPGAEFGDGIDPALLR